MFGNLFGSSKYSVSDQVQPPGQPQAPPSMPFPPQSSQPANVVGSTMDPSLRQGLSVLSHLDTRASQVLQVAQKETKRIQQALIEPEQVLYGLLFDGEVFKLISQFSSDPTKIVNKFAPELNSSANDVWSSAELVLLESMLLQRKDGSLSDGFVAFLSYIR